MLPAAHPRAVYWLVKPVKLVCAPSVRLTPLRTGEPSGPGGTELPARCSHRHQCSHLGRGELGSMSSVNSAPRSALGSSKANANACFWLLRPLSET